MFYVPQLDLIHEPNIVHPFLVRDGSQIVDETSRPLHLLCHLELG